MGLLCIVDSWYGFELSFFLLFLRVHSLWVICAANNHQFFLLFGILMTHILIQVEFSFSFWAHRSGWKYVVSLSDWIIIMNVECMNSVEEKWSKRKSVRMFLSLLSPDKNQRQVQTHSHCTMYNTFYTFYRYFRFTQITIECWTQSHTGGSSISSRHRSAAT